MRVYYMGAWSSCRSEEGVGFPGTGVHYGFEPPGGVFKIRCSARATHALNQGSISPASSNWIINERRSDHSMKKSHSLVFIPETTTKEKSDKFKLIINL